MTTLQAIRSMALAALFACAACQQGKPATSASIATPPSIVPTARPKLGFREAIASVESELKTTAQPLILYNGETVPGGWMFKTPNGLDHVAELHEKLLPNGAYLFLVQQDFDGPDVLGLVPTTDKYEVIRMVGTDGNSAHSHEEVVAWLKDLDRTEPWLLVGASFDFVDILFVDPVHDAHALAENVLSFCPDFYYQGIGLDPANRGAAPLQVTESYFQTERYSHFWWD